MNVLTRLCRLFPRKAVELFREGDVDHTLLLDRPLILHCRSIFGRYGAIFEIDDETGYLYALDFKNQEQPIQDAVHLFNIAELGKRRRKNPARLRLVWSKSGYRLRLEIDAVILAVLDFDGCRACCRTGFPPVCGSGWSPEGHAWRNELLAAFDDLVPGAELPSTIPVAGREEKQRRKGVPILDRLQVFSGLRPSFETWYEQREACCRKILGPMGDVVMHAIIPFAVGGGLDWYFYPNHLPGTVLATMELSEDYNRGASNRVYRNYELIMVSRLPFADFRLDGDRPPEVQRLYAIMNNLGRYGMSVPLNPGETLEFPPDFEDEQLRGACFIADAYPALPERCSKFGLMLFMEIHRSEMEFAIANGSAKLFELLKEAGVYPYTGTGRPPVI